MIDPIIPPRRIDIKGITAFDVSKKESTPTINVINPNPERLISLTLFGNLFPKNTPKDPVIIITIALSRVPKPGKNIFYPFFIYKYCVENSSGDFFVITGTVASSDGYPVATIKKGDSLIGLFNI